jgi:catechol 2,3-dioxygenase-like lactoylglutathione lyase family enzyme
VFDHVTIRATGRSASERFYDSVLRPLGVDRTYRTRRFSEWQDFSLAGADEENAPTRGLHVAFAAPSREHVDEFWRAGAEAGYADGGQPPGPMPEHGRDAYGALLIDPDGNRVEAVNHADLRRGGIVDHLRLGVADIGAAKRFYGTIATPAGLHLSDDTPEQVRFAGSSGALSLVSGEPTENLHIAFETDDDAAVQRFHEGATGAGYASNGPPGERTRYHPGYYAAYVRDPDGNNIEVVNHNRD